MISRKYLLFSLSRLPLLVFCDILTEETLIANLCLLKIETAHRFMRHQNEHSKGVK